MCFTTVNVHDMCVRTINYFQKFTAKLLSKENTRSNNNSGHTTLRLLRMCSVLNHAHCFTTTSGNNDLTFLVVPHTIKDASLMGAKRQSHWFVSLEPLYTKKTPLDKRVDNSPTGYVKFVIE